MTKKIREFLAYKPIPILKKQPFDCQLCGISQTSPERCLFENACKQFNKSGLHS
jgi:hypothetical protein